MKKPAPTIGFLTLRPVVVASVLFLAVAACNGGSAGNDNNDAGVWLDAGSTADAWTFECPVAQPDGNICIRGQIRDLRNDEPVLVPGGAIMTRFVAPSDEAFPDILDATAIVTEDGSFIFPSVSKAWVRDERDINHYQYGQFDLLLETDVPGFIVPDNKYGVEHLDWPVHPIVNYYLVPPQMIEAWAASWPSDSWLLQCNSLQPDLSSDYKVVIGATYSYRWERAGPQMFPVPREWMMGKGHPSWREHCGLPLQLDRLAVDGSVPGTWESTAGISVMRLPTQPAPVGQHVFATFLYDNFVPDWYLYPKWGMIGRAEEDRTGQVVVVHNRAL